jgi:multidrug resistance protein, MATE family
MDAGAPSHLDRSAMTQARLFAIAAPAMLANLTTPLLGIVGTAVIGRLGEAHLIGAVAMSAVVFDCIFWLFGFLRMGTVALTAQALGARDGTEWRAVLVRALLIAVVAGVVLIVFQVPLARAVYALMGGSAAVTDAAATYFFVRVWSAPFALASYAVLGWLVGLARAGTALLLQIAVNLLNMAATVVFVLGLGMGVAGAALGCVIAEIVGLLGGLAIALRLARGLTLDRSVVLDRARLTRMLNVNRDILIRTAALIVAFAFFTAQSARAGDITLAANSVLHNFTLIGSFFLDGFATAAQQLCGQAVGARDRDGFERAARMVILWGLGFGIATSAVFLAGGGVLIDAMTTNPEVRAAARQFLLLAALAPPAGALAYGFDGIYVGATWARDMRNLMLVALALYFVTWWALRPFGNAGLWWALLVLLIARGLLQAMRYPALVHATFR